MDSIQTAEDVRTTVDVFRDICSKQNISQRTIEFSISEFNRMKENYSTGSDDMIWLIVSLFATHQNEKTDPDINFIDLLNSNRIYLADFLYKLSKWGQMAKSEPLSELSDKIIREYNTSSRIFSTYIEKYSTVFQIPQKIAHLEIAYNRRKQRLKPVTDVELFYFIWHLFINARMSLTIKHSDFIFHLHLLMCCIQFAFNALMENQNLCFKLINKKFLESIKVDLVELKYKEKLSLLSPALFQYENDTFHKNFIKFYETEWDAILGELIANNYLKVHQKNVASILEPDLFAYNLNTLNHKYSETITESNFLNEIMFLYALHDEFNCFANVSISVFAKFHADTPQIGPETPVSTPIRQGPPASNKNLINLFSKIFIDNSRMASEVNESKLTDINLEYISDWLNKVTSNFKNAEIVPVSANIGVISGIYNKLLLSICKNWKQSNQNIAMGNLLLNTTFHSSIFACALEIVIFLLNDKNTNFLSILNILCIDAFEFFKVIELTVRSQPDFTRDIVRHLNKLEESIVNHYAWLEGSSLYRLIENNDKKVPTLKDVGFPYLLDSQFVDYGPSKNYHCSFLSPQTPKNTSKTTVDEFNNKFKVNSVTRNLFSTQSSLVSQVAAENVFQADCVSKSPTGFSNNVKIMDLSKINRTHKAEKNVSSEASSDTNSQTSSNVQLNALVFFMRKLYHLASCRLISLCDYFKMPFDVRSKCWTCLENIIQNCYFLFKGHYLDQLILCTVYAMGKSSNNQWSFHDLIKWYRYQEYSQLEVYRHVLLSPIDGPESSDQAVEVGDLINYYNKVFLSPLNKYLYQFLNANGDESIQLSPIPKFKSADGFQSQQISNAPIYVSPKKEFNRMISTTAELLLVPDSPLRKTNSHEIELLRSLSPAMKRKHPSLDELGMEKIVFGDSRKKTKSS